MADRPGRTPDWTLSAMDPDNICKGKVGAAWNNDDGSIAVKLSAFVVLDAMDDLKLRLFPYEGYKDRQKAKERASASTPAGKFDDFEDDIPF